jgi:hypothetical protein
MTVDPDTPPRQRKCFAEFVGQHPSSAFDQDLHRQNIDIFTTGPRKLVLD